MFDFLQIDTLISLAKQVGYYLLLSLGVGVLAFVVHFITQRYAVKLIKKGIGRIPKKWNKHILKGNLFGRLGLLLPGMVVYALIPVFFGGLPSLMEYVLRAVEAYLIIISLLVVNELLGAVYNVYQTFEVSKEKPIKGLIQIAKLIIFSLGGILMISRIVGQSPSLLLGSLGALTAVMMLVFKDPLLGFVGGFQLAANQMVKVGDWIEMPKHDANGDVIDISLTSVKVRNFDKTITNIPTYALTSDSFKNWRGMFESGGRRIKRSILIDQFTIKFCDGVIYERFYQNRFLKDYIEKHKIEEVTNLGLLRAYIVAYLESNDRIHKEGMLFLVRHLEPTENGLPLQIYVFTKDTKWRIHEEIQAEIFEHIIAMIPTFGLKIFQSSFEINPKEALQLI
ncbi:mechanosensitive ion channel protein MscS [Candidatus Aerophobetes bacterium]|uniref:Mechanosensing system component YbdG n=1 Tax=Aerophobetes bacterium TaxID=2030807 RepID=A0A2A4YBJ7_UNCAE|nr:MAG: mechanosensitive ion channel protein MscS [Candidatus Aerophobetes bacterium]